MAINRIEQLRTPTALPTGDDSQTTRSVRLELNTESTFERGSDSDFDPANFQLGIPEDQRRTAEARFNTLSESDKASVDLAVTNARSAVEGVVAGTTTRSDAQGAVTAALGTYSSALYSVQNLPANTYGRSSGNGEVTDIMVRIMGGVEDKTAQFAVDLQGKLNAKAEIRTQATELGDMITHWPEDAATQHFTWTSYDVDPNTGKVTTTQHSEDLTKDDALQLQKNMQAQLDTLSDVTQMQQVELQDKYQAQQEAMSTLSEILRSMHDTMKNTIANVKAS